MNIKNTLRGDVTGADQTEFICDQKFLIQKLL